MGSPHAGVGPHAPLPRELVSSDSPRQPPRRTRPAPTCCSTQHNPVDWYPWGEEAFVKARSEDKPIFLSVGYSTCHWCHVMERESFEDDGDRPPSRATASSPIKVDREELPDVDSVYMRRCRRSPGAAAGR